jgi:hypothetical protein
MYAWNFAENSLRPKYYIVDGVSEIHKGEKAAERVTLIASDSPSTSHVD